MLLVFDIMVLGQGAYLAFALISAAMVVMCLMVFYVNIPWMGPMRRREDDDED